MESQASSSPSPPFVEGLVYSQQRTGKRHVFGSLARRTQELGAELCGRLSQVLLQALPLSPPPTAGHTAVTTGTLLPFVADVQRDLSAHFGSHAVRRGLAKPFGPCVHPMLRRGKLTLPRAGIHGPRYMRLWNLRRTRRCWCPSCGVWLTRGADSAAQANKNILATVVDYRARRQQRRQRSSTRSPRRLRNSSRCSAPPTKKLGPCCVRCLQREQKRASRNACKVPQDVSSAMETPPRSSAFHAAKITKVTRTTSARQQRAQKTERAVAAVVAAARVPKRNRRSHRRSARRRQRKGEPASGKSKGKATVSAGGAGVPPTAAHVRNALAAALAKTATTEQPVVKATPSASVKPPVVRAAQRSLQGLVPSGPLKKLKAPAPRPRDQEEPAQPHQSAVDPTLPSPSSLSLVPSSSPAPSTQVPMKGAPQHHRLHPVETKGSRSTGAEADKHQPHSVSTKANPMVATGSTPAKHAAATPQRAATASGPASTAQPRPPVSLARVSAASSSALPTPKGPPVKAMPPKAVKPPAKAQPKTSGKAKLMNAMNQLGF